MEFFEKKTSSDAGHGLEGSIYGPESIHDPRTDQGKKIKSML